MEDGCFSLKSAANGNTIDPGHFETNFDSFTSSMLCNNSIGFQRHADDTTENGRFLTVDGIIMLLLFIAWLNLHDVFA